MRHVGRNAEHFPGTHDDLFSIDRKLQRAIQDVRHLLIVMLMHGDVGSLFQEHARKHQFVAHDHFAVDQVVQFFAFHFVPRDVFAFGFFAHRFNSP